MTKLSSARFGTKKKMPRNYKCKNCWKTYAMDWAFMNHLKHCK